jgi:ubiquinone/menaquinone biosynthesis C-methylase UbiE
MKEEVQSVVFDRAAGIYDATRGFPPGVEDSVAALIVAAGALGASSRVLEIGIGTGRIALPLARHVRQVAGVDLSAAMLAQLVAKRGAGRVDPVRADATRLPFPDACFDAVIAVHVFHLIPGWRDALAEVARVLRPDGALLHAADDQSAGGTSGVSPHRIAANQGLDSVGVPRARLEAFPEEEGWRPAAAVQRIRFSRTLAPQELVDRMEQRAWSATWRLSDEQLAIAVVQLRADLLARYGALDRAVEIETGFWVRSYRKPAR